MMIADYTDNHATDEADEFLRAAAEENRPITTVFTTGQVAHLCKVTPRTVSKWFDTGQLGGYRNAQTQDRRIPIGSLVDFLVKKGMANGKLADLCEGAGN